MRLLVLFASSICFSLFASVQPSHPPHLPLELTFEESLALGHKYKKLKSNQILQVEISAAIRGGERMNEWMDKINSVRAEDKKIRLTSKATRRGIPVDQPSKYGPKTIKNTYLEYYRDMPQSLKNVIYDNDPITSTLNDADEVFIEWARKVSRLYQTAVRWQGSIPWLSYYKGRKRDDIRGYYHLKSMPDLDQSLMNYSTLDPVEQASIEEHLISLCFNTQENDSKCSNEFNRYRSSDNLKGMKDRYWSKSESTWNSFFNISGKRNDVHWNTNNPNEMIIPFKEINDQKISDWLKENVEEEFRRPNQNWEMLIDYVRGGWGTAHLKFQAGVTPHVSGGNTIVMDKNVSIDEYSVKWTIRHEFGHILRLPDCYVEFYDEKEELMINYQLDTTDLMCSRAGDMNDRIYDELKRAYFRN